LADDARFEDVYTQLAAIYAPYRSHLVTVRDDPGDLYLEAPPSARYPNGLYFGAVKTGKRYVSFHLMPVYTNPELLDGISPALRKRMQGKSCFNFTQLDDTLTTELRELTAAGFAQFRQDGLVPGG
jgi:hypothetical protein